MFPAASLYCKHLIGDEISAGAHAENGLKGFRFPAGSITAWKTAPVRWNFSTAHHWHSRISARVSWPGCLAEFHDGGPMTILTATSGDTGAAVAHAYYGQPGIEVIVLYPKGKDFPLTGEALLHPGR